MAQVARRPRILTPKQELAKAKALAWDIWLEVRKRNGIQQFTDPLAKRYLKTAVERAWTFVLWADIETAIR